MAVVYVPDATNVAQPADSDYAYLQAAELRTLKTYLQAQLAFFGTPMEPSILGRKNAVINGSFDFWDYNPSGTVVTTAGFIGPNRWEVQVGGGGSTTTNTSRYDITLGTAADYNESHPHYALNFESVLASSNAVGYARLSHKIENLAYFAGRDVTLSFWTKSASGGNQIAIEFYQDFGTGGGPGIDINGIGVSAASKKTLGTTWQKHSLTVSVPSILGETEGTNGDAALGFYIWLSAGSSFNARTMTLGEQNASILLSDVQLELGSVATKFDYRPLGEEEMLCARYLPVVRAASNKGGSCGSGLAISATVARLVVPFSVPARCAPTGVSGPTSASVQVVNGSGANVTMAATALSFVSGGTNSAVIAATAASGLTAGQATYGVLSPAATSNILFTGCEL